MAKISQVGVMTSKEPGNAQTIRFHIVIFIVSITLVYPILFLFKGLNFLTFGRLAAGNKAYKTYRRWQLDGKYEEGRRKLAAVQRGRRKAAQR